MNAYRRYFQKLDKEMHLKILERQILDTIVRFLDARNIDTSDLKERQTTILNNGLVVSGSGSIQAESLAVGPQAQALVDKVKRKRPASAESRFEETQPGVMIFTGILMRRWRGGGHGQFRSQ